MGLIKKTNSFLLSGQLAKARNSGNYQGVLQELTQKNFNIGNEQGVKDLFLSEMRFHSGKSRPVLLSITRNRSDYLYLLFIASLELCIELYGKVDVDSLSNYVGQKDFLRNVGPANDSFAFLVKVYELLEASNVEVPVNLLKSLQSLISKEQEVLRVMEEFQQE